MVDGVVLVDELNAPCLGETVPFVEIGGWRELVSSLVLRHGIFKGPGLSRSLLFVFLLSLRDKLVDRMRSRCDRDWCDRSWRICGSLLLFAWSSQQQKSEPCGKDQGQQSEELPRSHPPSRLLASNL